jgi:deoxyribodipyrimidine photo-lyase
MSRWPAASDALLSGDSSALAKLPIDHSVRPSFIRGGALQAQRALKTFGQSALDRYPDDRNQPEIEGTSRLSPYLHFGHIGAHEILAAILRHEGVSPGALALKRAGGSRASWGLSEASEAFLDQLVTWRELGFNMCAHRPDYDRYESLPAWARRTLAEHASDPRPATYPLAELERAATHDPLWNAAQMQLVRDGWQHNYMRMLWGKKILEWSATPELALEAMVNLMNKYSLDGRNPNSYSGYFWVLGRYDRPWGPERPIFGNVRYMSSASTAKKLRVRKYIEKYVP